MIAAYAAAAVIKPELRDARMLVTNGGAVDAIAPDATRTLLIPNAQDAAYSPDGTLVAFARGGDIWIANADGSGERRLAAAADVAEWGPSWLPGGASIVYTASVGGTRQIRMAQLPTPRWGALLGTKTCGMTNSGFRVTFPVGRSFRGC